MGSKSSLYQPLEVDSIRVLHLDGFKFVQPPDLPLQVPAIACSLETVPVARIRDGLFRYTALSYCWSSPESNKYIFIDGEHVVKVTENLYNALYELAVNELRRQSGDGCLGESHVPSLPIWVDAVCINQAHRAEKTQQLSLMGEIYQLATFVTVWLEPVAGSGGREVGGFWSALEAADNAGPAAESSAKGDSTGDLSRPRGRNKLVGAFGMADSACRAGGEFLTQNPWFTRAWTLQEIVLATSAVVRCGPFVVKWPTLERAMKMMMDAGMLKTHSIHTLQDLRKQWHDESGGPGSIRLCSLLGEAVRRREQEPHDKIYSLMAMCPAGTLSAPDYDRPLKEVFAEAAAAVMQEQGDLRFLDILDLPEIVTFQNYELPDWQINRVYTHWRSWIPALNRSSWTGDKGDLTSYVPNFEQESPFKYNWYPDGLFDSSCQSISRLEGGTTLVCKGALLAFFHRTTERRETQVLPYNLDRRLAREFRAVYKQSTQMFKGRCVELPGCLQQFTVRLRIPLRRCVVADIWQRRNTAEFRNGYDLYQDLDKLFRSKSDVPGYSALSWHNTRLICHLFGSKDTHILSLKVDQSGQDAHSELTGTLKNDDKPFHASGDLETFFSGNHRHTSGRSNWIPVILRIRG